MLKIWFTLFVFHSVTSIVAFEENDRCGAYGSGRCKLIWYCPEALDMVAQGRRPYTCGFFGNDPIVCCISEMYDNDALQNPSYISQKKCQEYEEEICAEKKNEFQELSVVGGVDAQPSELPFMGLVGYGNRPKFEWACGCSLISEKFVLSAAHCTKHPNWGVARWVRLGELDLASTHDKAKPENFRIIRRINHPDYREELTYNDIAIFELEYVIHRFTSFIQPICLPKRESFENIKTVVGAGWGVTDVVAPRSTKLLKVDLNYYSLDKCQNTASDRSTIPEGLDEITMICAGSLEGGKDTCLGDSGGPLFLPRDTDGPGCSLFTQLGITSFGKLCAVKGLPGVYTNVLNYIPWIESIVWPRINASSRFYGNS